jgi:transposase-like protein
VQANRRNGVSRKSVKNKVVHLALGVTGEGQRQVLGLWIAENEGTKFWLAAMMEYRNRGVRDILTAVVDGLKSFPEAIIAAFPGTIVQACLVFLVRRSLNFCSWKDRKAVTAELRDVYGAETAEVAWAAVEPFDADCGRQYPSIAKPGARLGRT